MAKNSETSLSGSFAAAAAFSIFAAIYIGSDISRFQKLGLPAERIAEKMTQQTYCWYAAALFAVISVVIYAIRNAAGLRRRQQAMISAANASQAESNDAPTSSDSTPAKRQSEKVLVNRK